ncbi:hypothetical protein [Marinisporobacter balticus]|uniref:Oligosaccharide repeat unit polymerase n=1 Tax=Marinisporobacter balticus TaxID=2018667 RepID=A0A4R2L815_9FIRM|nr:hypothetical protein [Marinisporobacter balticus]TCO78828.1 hypothetical protein EV214_104215 [Marinisporobacter balticus]
MQIAFMIISILGLIFFMNKKRKFDFFTLAYISAIVYFLPGFYGYVFLPGWIQSSILKETYLVMCLVLVSIGTGAIIYDIININKKEQKKISVEGSQNILFFITIISFLGLTLMIITMGSSLLSANKQIVLSNGNRWSLLWENTILLGIVFAFITEKKKLFWLFFIMMSFHIYMGFRSTAAIAIISIMTHWLNLKGKQRLLINNIKSLVIGIVVAIFFFSYKQIYIPIKLGMWDLVVQKISSIQFYVDSIRYSEPFGIQVILNEVIRTDFKVGLSHFKSIAYQVILFANKLGGDSTSFNSLFQNAMFPKVNYGMGSNIWAEMWASGGWGLLILFIIFYVIILSIGSKLMENIDSNIKPLILISMSYWSFYIHRNSLVYEINLIKRVICIWTICIMISAIIPKISKNTFLKG